jgi:hypothetical protein
MKKWLPILLLVLTIPVLSTACGDASQTTPVQPVKQLNPTWASLGVDLPIDGATIDDNFDKLVTFHYPTDRHEDTRGVHAAMLEAFRSAGWKEQRNDELGPASFDATYMKEKKAVGIFTKWEKKNGKGFAYLSLRNTTKSWLPEKETP